MNDSALLPTRAGGSYGPTTTCITAPGVRANEARWLWAASGPRGHQSGAETTADRAAEQAYAAFSLLRGERERAQRESKESA